MLLWQIHSELVQHLPGVTLQGAKEGTTPVDHDEAELAVIGEQSCESLGEGGWVGTEMI